jgi:hypothetical protein
MNGIVTDRLPVPNGACSKRVRKLLLLLRHNYSLVLSSLTRLLLLLYSEC